MVRLDVDRRDSVQLRFASSPLWECVISVRALRDPARHPLHAPWARRATTALAGASLDMLPALVGTGDSYIPDFIAPPPTEPGRRFETEVDRLRATPAMLVQDDLARAAAGPNGGGAAALLERYAGREPALLEILARELERYWSLAIAPDWPQLEAILEREIMLRARELALEGASALLAGLHPDVAWRRGALAVDRPGRDSWARVGRTGLLLVPSVFAWPDVFTVTDDPWRVSLYYPASAIGSWISPNNRPSQGALNALTGQSRARVLRALTEPVTTLELARRLDLPASAISRHLTAFAAAGLVGRIRVGRRVFYQPTAVLTTVLHLLDT